ncbi:NAD(P)/FAD-dependent oxidoreductase [Pararhodobacter sp.]|uniref:NAD(P)/FAD-dependent oxidoreductase n=1 Tax=Pararhodobacter sp. TaxID=2127056 RepID=UPI002FDE15A7
MSWTARQATDMADIAVIGAGVIGLTTALRLCTEGHAVTLIAPQEAPHMASTGNAGTIAEYAIDPVATPGVLRALPQLLFDPLSPLAIHRPSLARLAPWLLRFGWQALPGPSRRNRRALVPLLAGAGPLWDALAQETGAATLLRPRGALYAFDTPAALRDAAEGLERRRLHGVAVELIDGAALERLEPGLPQGRFAGAAHFPGTRVLDDPGQMLARIAATAQARGVQRIDATLSALSRTAGGWRMALDSGATHSAEQIVLAAGAWSQGLALALGLAIPLDTERGYHLEFDLPEDAMPLARPLCPDRFGFYLTPMQGRLRAAGTVELGGLHAPPSPHRWDQLEKGARAVFPGLPPVARRWMGLRPSLPDSLPVIGPAGPQAPGAWLAFGHGHIGLTLAPRTAGMLADMIAGRPPALDPAPYSAARFTRRSAG